jgi:alkaline phosphatase
VKTRAGVLSVNQYVRRKDHKAALDNKLATIVELAEQKGLSTGIVTTSRVTHATPAACYAYTPERSWEDDAALTPQARADDFPDIARQLIEFPFGDGIDIVLGGGRMNFLPNTSADPQNTGKNGRRLDGRHLINEWTDQPEAAYVWNKEQLDKLDLTATKRVLGLFSYSHMEYEYDRPRKQTNEPSLRDMTSCAIDLLAQNQNGYFLMVEGARIDHAHHEANAFRALYDTIEFARAVQVAIEKTKSEETLIIVTADHSHVFTMAGYPTRGNPILGRVVGNDRYGEPGSLALDLLGMPYTTLGYANGPGYTGESDTQPEGTKRFPHYPRHYKGITSGRPDLRTIDAQDHDFLMECTVPLDSETHGGEDVIAYAYGPMAHLMTGVQEQNYIFHVMLAALELPDSKPKTAAPAPPDSE